jgi:arylsulfatase
MQCILLAVVSALLLVPGVSAQEKKPNIIYLMLDEWGYFESGHMGSKDLTTPNIDQFAKDGMRFTNAYAGAPVCGPDALRLIDGVCIPGHTSMRSNNGFRADSARRRKRWRVC